ncbi:MAG TPA: hypothetical protein VE422_34060 [Terriglobia bacterium]|nr:hypothetical protein [Terriglobia bacterium]
MIRFAKHVLAPMTLMLALASLAEAQANRTWVSGVGDDVNPCSRTAPCKTFAGAISKTAAGGEISVLDPGGYGAVTITKSITISGDGTLAGILNAGQIGVIVNAGANDVVTLRNLSIHGAGTGTDGVKYIAGRMLVVEHCNISGYQSHAIDVALTAAGGLIVRDTTMTGGATGILMTTTSGTLTGVAQNVSIRNAASGVHTLAGAIHVFDSVITGSSSYAMFAEGGIISLENSLVVHNNIAVQAQANATIRLSNNDFYDNLTAFACGAGTVMTAANNRKQGNSGGSVAACPPNGSITIQ